MNSFPLGRNTAAKGCTLQGQGQYDDPETRSSPHGKRSVVDIVDTSAIYVYLLN